MNLVVLLITNIFQNQAFCDVVNNVKPTAYLRAMSEESLIDG
jgi:hypothetical protein